MDKSSRLAASCLLIGGLLSNQAYAVQFFDRSKFIPLGIVIVKVEARLDDGRLFVGTGVTVGPGIVLTNCHVMPNAERITVSKRSGRFEATAQHAAGSHDLCFLKVPKWRGPAIEIASSTTPRIHQLAAAIGYTGGAQMSFSEGNISAVYPYKDSYLLQTSTGFSSGASGGALLNEQAQLIGILTFRLPGRSGHYYAVPAAWVVSDMPSDADWRPIGTPIKDQPFWQGKIETLPYFMRIAPLEAQSRWDDLLTLTKSWAMSEPESPEPLIAQGRVLSRLNRLDDAIATLARATEQDPLNSEAWLELGKALIAVGRDTELESVRQQLTALDTALLDELDLHLGTTKATKPTKDTQAQASNSRQIRNPSK